MAKYLTPEEVRKLQKSGAKFEKKPEKPVQVDGLAELIAELSRIASANEMSADKQREELKETLEKLVYVLENREKTDLTPLTQLLGRIALNTQPEKKPEPCAYEHEIKRNSRGDMVAIKSTPKQENIH